MNTPKVSIIMPVYNAEALLSKMVDSIIAQSFKDWELLAIDDGSTDNSGALLDKYAESDSRIRVFHKKNGGVSAARQLGLEKATGEYLIHADADDWVEPTMLQELYNKAREENADVVICDFFVDNNNQSVYRKQKPSSMTPKSLVKQLFQQLHGSCWNKLVKRVCYSKYNISFPIGVNYCEDLLTWVQLFLHDEVKVSYLPKAFYHYVQNDGSITHHYTQETYKQRQRYQQLLEEYLSHQGFEREIRNSKLVVFTEAFMRGILSNGEAWKQLWENSRAAFWGCPNRRWFVGYIALAIGCFPLAKRLITWQ